MKSLLAIVSLFVACSYINGTPRYVYETKLREELFLNYNKDVIPYTGEKAVRVDFGMALINVNSVDVKSGIADLNTWLRLAWNDYRLRWDPSKFGNVSVIRVDTENIWIPDLSGYDSPGVSKRLSTPSQASALVYNTGHILYIPPARIEMRGFQHGPHFNISMRIGSWVFDGNLMDLAYYEGYQLVDLSDYATFSEWSVVDTKLERHVKIYPCCEEPYLYIDVNITLVRK